MGNKSKLLALFVAFVAVVGGGIYYWLEVKPYQDFLSILAQKGVTYEQIEEGPSGTFKLANATVDIGEGTAVVFEGFTFTKGEEAYALALAELENSRELLQAIGRRGITYDWVEKTPSDGFNFVNARLDVGANELGILDNFTVIKAESGYDLTIENLEMEFGLADAKLSISHIEVKSLEFADKIEATANGLQTLGFLAPFLHDKAASIRLENISASGSFTFMDMSFSASLAIGEELLEDVERGKIASYRDKNITFDIEISSPLTELADMIGEGMSIEITNMVTRDFDLARSLELMFLSQANPDAPFETIYSAQEIENLQISQKSDEAQTIYAKIRSSGLTMRGSSKAPVAFIEDLMGMQDLLSQDAEDLSDDPRILALMADAVSLVRMVGRQESVTEGMRQTHQIENIGPLVLEVGQIHSLLEEGKLDFSYQDMKIATDIVEIDIGKIALADFSYIRLIDGLHEVFKTLLLELEAMEEQGGEQRFFTAMMSMLPHFAAFSIEDFHLAGAKNFPLKGLIGEWSFERIALSNEYAFDEALIPTSATLEIEDFSVPSLIFTQSLPAGGSDVACMLDGSNANMTYRIKAFWDAQSQDLYYSDQIESNIAGGLSAMAQLGNVPERFFSFNPPMREEEYREIRLKDIKMTYDPQGREAAFFACLAKQWPEMSAAQWRELVASYVETLGFDEEIEAQLKPMRDVLANFVRQGGKLIFSMKAKNEAGASFGTISRLNGFNNPFALFEIDLKPQP